MKQTTKKILSAVAYPAVITVAVIVLWQIAAAAAGSEFIFPSLGFTVKSFFSMLTEAETYAALSGTLGRTVLSFVISVVIALALALLAATNAVTRRLLSPVVSVCRSLPTMAVTLVFAIWLGKAVAPVVVSLLVIMPTAYAGFCEAIEAVDRDMLDMARIDGASNLKLIIEFLLPLCLSSSKDSTAATFSLNIKLMVAAEVLSHTARSLGNAMYMASTYFETARLMALTVLTVLVSVISEWLLKKLFSLACARWE